MRQHSEDLDRLGAAVVVVSFEPLPQLQQFAHAERLPFLMASDPERKAYGAFGLQEGGMFRLLSLGTARVYLRGLVRGRWPRAPRTAWGNLRQLGGDVVIDASGRVAFLHRSREPSDRPEVSVLLRALELAPRSPHTS